MRSNVSFTSVFAANVTLRFAVTTHIFALQILVPLSCNRRWEWLASFI